MCRRLGDAVALTVEGAPLDTNRSQVRSFGVVGLLVLVGIYLVLLQGGGLLLAQVLDVDANYGEFPDLDSLLAGVTIPVALSVLLLVCRRVERRSCCGSRLSRRVPHR
jgi:hypothetical protein